MQLSQPMLTRTIVLLERDESADSTFGDYVSFGSPDSGVGAVWLDREVWADMAYPDEITVTVVPGDTLNGAA